LSHPETVFRNTLGGHNPLFFKPYLSISLYRHDLCFFVAQDAHKAGINRSAIIHIGVAGLLKQEEGSNEQSGFCGDHEQG
jgi:hypothetical protein